MSENTTISEIKSKNRAGVERVFVMRQHPFRPGLAVVDKLLQAGLGPVVELIFSAVDLPKDFDKLPKEEQARLFAEMSTKLDKTSIVKQVTDGLARGGGLEAMAPDLLAYTSLDGQDLRGSHLDVTFQGNYGELLALCRKSIEHNGFFDLLSTFESD